MLNWKRKGLVIMKKIISLVLAFVMAFSVLSLTASAAVKTECNGDCDRCPSIVVPGIGQSNVWALDENGNYLLDDNGERISCFPAVFDVGSIVAKVLAPALLTLMTQHDVFLSEALCSVAHCSPRVSQESFPTSQFKGIDSSALCLLHSPTLTSIHDHRKNHSLD